MSEEKRDKVEIPLGDPYLEELDPERYRANQLAHEGMRRALSWREAERRELERFDNGTVGARWRRYVFEATLVSSPFGRTLTEYKQFVSGLGEEEE